MNRKQRAVILHGYSSENKGDGLLVDRAIDIARDALGSSVDITLTANHPASFGSLGINVVDSGLRRGGFSREYLRLLRSLDDFDLVIGVGGAYLRFGTIDAALKASVIHLPQLVAAARTCAPVVYLPQSIGPLRGVFRPVVRRLLRRIDTVWLRDDRSVAEVDVPSARRSMDLALHDIPLDRGRAIRFDGSPPPILSVRMVDGGITEPLMRLAELIRPFDGYVQSVAGANDDRAATEAIRPATVATHSELMIRPHSKRVIIAVRMHAALMALAAGHYVIHLAYERKGFSAFADLGLAEYVHNVRNFDPLKVLSQARGLQSSSTLRCEYEEAIRGTARARQEALEGVAADLDVLLANDRTVGMERN